MFNNLANFCSMQSGRYFLKSFKGEHKLVRQSVVQQAKDDEKFIYGRPRFDVFAREKRTC